MKRILVLLLILTFPSSWAEVAKPSQTAETKCGDWARLTFPDFYVENNVWGKRDITDYKQCIFRADKVFGWEWTWPSGAPDVVAYPEISFGWKPWNSQSTTPKLPLQVSKVKKALVTYDLSMKSEGIYNLAFDACLTREPKPNEKNITAEIMIWLDHDTLKPDGSSSEAVTIDGETYDFYKGQPPHAEWPYLAFIKKTPRISGKTDFRKFLDYLVRAKHVSPNDYLASIEFGNEVYSGTGKTEVKKYVVEIGKR